MRAKQFRLKPVCASLLLAFAAHTAQANPIGAAVVSGQASFATKGNTLTVTNTPNTIINWQGFSIGANEITRFAQQSASSAVLNRVIANNPSNILGSLQSNGRVFLVNPSGIVFGANATVNVAGMIASTLNISNADFLAGRYNFTNVPGAHNISNAGSITAETGGQIYLIAPNVENTGIINAPNGEILLAAGHSVELVNSNDPNLRVNITAPAGDATNVGQLVASSGSLGLFGAVVKNTGTVSANSATMQGGKIVFKASQRVDAGGTISAQGVGGGSIAVLADMQTGTVNVTGTLDASSIAPVGAQFIAPSSGIATNQGAINLAPTNATNGGTIQVLGNQVGIMDGATVTANGTQNGGTILIGGDYQGKNPNVQNAQVTYVAPTATLSADGGTTTIPSPSRGGLGWGWGEGVGNGGKLIVWADNTTRAYGNLSAKGGVNGGNGGFIETSGHYLDVAGIKIDATALNGKSGSWLLDPWDVNIAATFDTRGTFSAGIWTPNASGSTITAATIVAALNAGTSVTITTAGAGTEAGNITVNAAISSAVTGVGTTLTLNADNNIDINQSITTTGSLLNLVLNYGAAGSATLSSTLALAGGTLDVKKAGVSGAGILNITGALDGVTIGSNLTTSGSFDIYNSLMLGNGVTVNKGGDTWYFRTTGLQHIGVQGGTGSATLNSAGGSLYAGYGVSGQTLQIDSGVTLQGYSNLYQSSAATLVNNGSITVNTAGQTININPATFTNNGTMSATAGTMAVSSANFTNSATCNISASAGTTFNITGTTFINDGTISSSGTALNITPSTTFTNNGTVNFNGTTLGIGAANTNWINPGTVNFNTGTLNLNGQHTVASLTAEITTPHYSRGAGTAVNLTGTLDLSAGTLNVGSAGPFGTGGLNAVSGTIKSGTVLSGDGTVLNITGALDGVTIGSNLTTSGSFDIYNSLMLGNG
ncbi:MAG: filamentous hemagglutinin N-terminal domain-containing protein, partial [Gallionella sp.]|nr:filamentous hemagglutinin N-terminal domain-containing protein [Gallionella sp.]